MKNTLQSDIGKLILRVFPSMFMLTHGIPKLQKTLNGDFSFGNPLGIGEAPSLFLAIIAEVVCPILIIVGYRTRWASIPVIITMSVAAFIVHQTDGFKRKEMALVYLVCFLAIALIGPGKFSLDRK
ncbi:DoxX family protein [Eudoraea chungangensis]|uniref:DoxX family protein n=1 Tax=Eudoraea chungangensis TaxID=1481905 RepID=UPI0023EC683C|nr:DoxX family protein [Eudoraea chungangensis]